MYVRVLQIKFPNELAKKSVMVLQRGIMKDYFKYGLLMRINTEISTNSLMITGLWKTQEFFEQAREKYGDKFVSEVKEMGCIVTILMVLQKLIKLKKLTIQILMNFNFFACKFN